MHEIFQQNYVLTGNKSREEQSFNVTVNFKQRTDVRVARNHFDFFISALAEKDWVCERRLLICPMKIMIAIWGSNFGIRVPSSGLSTFIIYARAANLTVYGHSPSHSLCNLLHYLPTKPSTQDATFKIVKNMRLVLAWSEINLLHRKGQAKDTSYKLICRFEMKLFRCLKLCSVLKRIFF